MKNVFKYQLTIGSIYIAEINGKISDVVFSEKAIFEKYEVKETSIIIEAKKQLEEYFAGERKIFHLPLEFTKGTDFQKEIWKTLLKIPYGKTKSYKEVAEMAGNPKACRAVGGANNKNPIAIIVPCHRVIGRNGSLVGYAQGLNVKKRLLEIEAETETETERKDNYVICKNK